MKYLCPKEVAAQFGISERTVRRMIAAGHVQAFRIGAKCGAQIKLRSTTTSIRVSTDITGGNLAYCDHCLVSRTTSCPHANWKSI
jgi:excisionase family DNA binding protein